MMKKSKRQGNINITKAKLPDFEDVKPLSNGDVEIALDFTEDEYELICEQAKECGMSPDVFVIEAAMAYLQDRSTIPVHTKAKLEEMRETIGNFEGAVGKMSFLDKLAFPELRQITKDLFSLVDHLEVMFLNPPRIVVDKAELVRLSKKKKQSKSKDL